jgi:SpoVK/Ycf46/Vps4 family AAA+-type ATPase
LDPVELLEDCFRLAPAARFDSRDFAHLSDDLHWLSRLLEQAVRQQTEGVNVLIFGPPGTGKTELVRTLAKQLGLALYEVSTEDRDGDPLSPGRRIQACHLAQRLLRRRGNCVLLFDEIEDIFQQRYPEEHSFRAEDCNKGWINQLLETNPVPVLWLSNRVRHIDNAFLRRFDFVLEMETPPKEVRQRILRQHLEGLPVSANWLNRISELEQLTPAHIGRAARVTRLIAPDAAEANERCLERIMTGSLEVMGFATRPTAPTVVSGYDPALVNGSMDLGQLAEGLARTGSGRICLYGPPGTGKSAYAAWLAATLNRPLVKKLASDLLNCFVGGTEANLAAMFREAEQQDAVLLLDEADSFLQDRQGAQRSWEVTQVNELLVQMETFQGIFICATNLMERLDPAVLRRFDVKLKLEYLKPGQAERLFRQVLSGAGQPDEAVLKGLRALTNLTPGDFATVTRLARVIGLLITPEWLLAALTEECRAKPGANRAIGFVV